MFKSNYSDLDLERSLVFLLRKKKKSEQPENEAGFNKVLLLF